MPPKFGAHVELLRSCLRLAYYSSRSRDLETRYLLQSYVVYRASDAPSDMDEIGLEQLVASVREASFFPWRAGLSAVLLYR
ncbi:MAG: hypothetical protein EBT43_05950 [Methylocystaceae bacterium]|nr:hypothetical protein [Methylocystaceae bacterium]